MHSEVNTRDIQPSTKVDRLVLTALFLSGMTAIAYEIIWQRLLVRTTGATLPAVSQIFCVFIAGLWAGSLLSIPILRKSTTPLRTYAFLELAIAIFAILIPVFFGEQLSAEFLRGTHVLVQLFTSKSDNLELMSAVVQNFLYFVILFVPAVLMGVTFNCVTKYLDDSRSPSPSPSLSPSASPGFSLSSGYAVNFFGGTCGCVLISFWLIPQVGLSISSMVLALVNLVAFFLLLLASLLSQQRGEPFAQLIALFNPPTNGSTGGNSTPAPMVIPEGAQAQVPTFLLVEQNDLPASDSTEGSAMPLVALPVPKQNERRAAKKAAKLLAKQQAKQQSNQPVNAASSLSITDSDSNSQSAATSGTRSAPSGVASAGVSGARPRSQEIALGLLPAIFIAFISSGAIMVLEVVGTRLMLLLLGSSTYSLSSVLFSAFLAFAVSAQLVAWRVKKQRDLQSFIPLLLLISSLAICGGMWLVQFLPLALIVSQRYLMQTSLSPFLSFVLPRMIICCCIFVPPLATLGAIFPILLASTQRQADSYSSNSVSSSGGSLAEVDDFFGSEFKRTTSVGLLFAASSAGAIAGCVVAAFYLIPNSSFDLNGVGSKSGIETSLSTMTLFLLFMAVSVRVALRDKAKPVKSFVVRSQIFMFCCMAAGYATCLRAPWDLLMLSLGPSYFQIPETSHMTQEKLLTALRKGNGGRIEPLFYKEGANSTVTVEQNTANNVRFLKNNGKVEAALPLDWRKPAPTSDASTQLILGALPFYFLDKKSDVQSLIIGYGSGITSGAVDCRPECGSVKIAELEPAVYKASRWFIASNLDPFRSARKGVQRVWGLVTDGRAFLRIHQATYDLIISQPSEPWVSGASDLFTREFWQLAASRLNAGGVMCQWVQLYSIDQQTLSELIATFTKCFPESYLVHPAGAGEILLIGLHAPVSKGLSAVASPNPSIAPSITPTVGGINSFLAADSLIIAPRLSPSGEKVSPPTLSCDLVLGPPLLRRLAGGSQLNTDDRLLPEYKLPSLVMQKNDPITDNLRWLNAAGTEGTAQK
jgi:spermidine synthase